jgi:hypothetical protein
VRRPAAGGFNQIEAQVIKIGMIAEATKRPTSQEWLFSAQTKAAIRHA